LHTAFPKDAEEEYATQMDIILQTLKLDKLREEELAKLAQAKSKGGPALSQVS